MPIEIDEEVDIKHFTENKSFEKIPKLIEFRADWCGPCRQMEPIMDEIEVDYFQKIHVLSVDVDNNAKITNRYNVRNIPTTILINAKGEQVDRIVGAVPKEQITDKIDAFLNAEKPTLPMIEMVPGRVLTTIRRFIINKDFDCEKSGYTLKGDIFEEIFNQPNTFHNITKGERNDDKKIKPCLKIKDINSMLKQAEDDPKRKSSRGYRELESLDVLESIDVKDSIVFQKFAKKAVNLYKKNIKKLAEANEDLTVLRHILEIENED